MPLTSHDIVAGRIEALRELFPEAFSEGVIDFAKLKQALGDFTDDSSERYGLSWAGKSEAVRLVQSLSSGTLVPCKEESVNFDTSENLIIEGDNLEALKLLQKSYYGMVKMIYIDPPYNTGNEFIYPDNYHEGLDGYLRYSGQVSDEGLKLETNAETSGRFHSKWLSMMYPRLFLAKNLLEEEGVIFVSIDDNEVHNLRLLMNEVFGEENFLAVFVRKRRMSTGMRDEPVSPDHEYVVSFAKSAGQARLFGKARLEDDYPLEDAISKYRSTDLTVGMTKEMRPNQFFEIFNPQTGKGYWPPDNRVWRFQPSTMRDHIDGGNIIWPDDQKDESMTRPRFKTRYEPSSPNARTVPVSTWMDSSRNQSTEEVAESLCAGLNQEGTKELMKLFGTQVMEYPKPVSLIHALVKLSTSPGDIVLDFFAGSGTTAHAVLELNQKGGGNRKYALIQLPEPAENGDFSTLADLCKERVRRVIKKMNDENGGKLNLDNSAGQDRGFKVFKLTSSNFKLWDADEAPKDADALAEQLKLYADHIVPGRSQDDILYELLLKAGLLLTAKIDEKEVRGQKVFSVADGLLLICLEDEITQETLRGMIELKPEMVLCLDNAFKGNDQLKTNIVLEMESHEIKFHTV